MQKLIRPGRLFFAVGLIALAIMQFILGSFILSRPHPWPWKFPGDSAWAWGGGFIFLATGITVLIGKKAKFLLLATAAIIFLYAVLPHLPAVVRDAVKGNFQTNVFKAIAFCGGAFIIAASFPAKGNQTLQLTGRILMAIFFLVCGIQHFQYFKFVSDLIPVYIPARPFWTALAGVALIAAALGLVINRTAKLAALLAGIMIFLWFVLLHIPRAIADPENNFEWMGVFESLALSGALLALAGMLEKKNE